MADQIIELLELIEKDPARLPEFYSAVANSDVVVPMILPPGRVNPVPLIWISGKRQAAITGGRRRLRIWKWLRQVGAARAKIRNLTTAKFRSKINSYQ